MVPNRNESPTTARLTGLQRKKMMAGGKPVLPVFGTLTRVMNMDVLQCMGRRVRHPPGYDNRQT